MVTPQVHDVVERSVRIAARPEPVFLFLVDPDKMRSWMGTAIELDPRPGGLYRVNVTGRNTARGEFLEVEPNRRVVFTWGWEEAGESVPPGSSRVEISLERDGDGTLVRLRHSGLPLHRRDSHGHGWQHYLDRFASVATGGDPGIDPWTQPDSPMDGQNG
jgi:uncharacterized protein YndB with AHSA1/START domain